MHPRDVQTEDLAQLDAAEVTRRLQRLAELEQLVAQRSNELAWVNENLVSALYERHQAEAEASNLAHFDAATGLPNRSAFEARLTAVLDGPAAHDAPTAVLAVGVERLATMRDALGFAGCDRVLRSVAERLRQAVRGSDLVARISEDSFAVGLTHMRAREDAAVVARKLKQVLDAPLAIDQQTVRVSASIGIALFEGDVTTPDELLTRADSAMRQASARNDGQFLFFYEGLGGALNQQLTLEAELRAAVAQHRFINHYQPRFNLKTGACVGAETFVRWLHPERGMLYPAEFLDLAKSTGLIVPIGVQVLRQACMDAVRWAGHGIIAVNLSAREFHGDSLIASIRQALKDSGLPPQRLQLEVTEDSLRCMGGEVERCSLMLDVIESLSTLRAMGIRVALDDFGSGVASLSTLHNYDVDAIKIDTQFVALLPEDKKAATLVAGIVDLARRLKVGVVAEGVESPEQIEFLRRVGCAEAQGYGLARPQTAVEVTSLMATAVKPKKKRAL